MSTFPESKKPAESGPPSTSPPTSDTKSTSESTSSSQESTLTTLRAKKREQEAAAAASPAADSPSIFKPRVKRELKTNSVYKLDNPDDEAAVKACLVGPLSVLVNGDIAAYAAEARRRLSVTCQPEKSSRTWYVLVGLQAAIVAGVVEHSLSISYGEFSIVAYF